MTCGTTYDTEGIDDVLSDIVLVGKIRREAQHDSETSPLKETEDNQRHSAGEDVVDCHCAVGCAVCV
jgi:hypothetical protein